MDTSSRSSLNAINVERMATSRPSAGRNTESTERVCEDMCACVLIVC